MSCNPDCWQSLQFVSQCSWLFVPCRVMPCYMLCGLRYPIFAGGLLSNWQLIEGMKETFCYTAQDYGGLLQQALAEPSTAGEALGRLAMLLIAFQCLCRVLREWG
jgi:hypothetical protein